MAEYTVLNKAVVLNEIMDAQIKDDENFHLYIHSPFCVNQCRFCKYQGTSIKNNGEIYKEYFNVYLPSVIDFYSPILQTRTPNAVYFGGGTASIMTHKMMENIFNKIPNFREIPDKVFECDMNLLTKEKTQILLDYNFTKISFGVQTFNENILKKNNRKNPDLNKIKEIVSFFQEHNVLVNCDIMTFIDNEDESDFDQLIIDMKKMTNTVKPNQICLYPSTTTISKIIEENNIQRAEELTENLRKTLIKKWSYFNNYIINENYMELFKNRKESVYSSFKFHREDSDMKRFLNHNSYKANCYSDQILLGIGSYKGNGAYTSIRKQIHVEEYNETNNINDMYYRQMESPYFWTN